MNLKIAKFILPPVFSSKKTKSVKKECEGICIYKYYLK